MHYEFALRTATYSVFTALKTLLSFRHELAKELQKEQDTLEIAHFPLHLFTTRMYAEPSVLSEKQKEGHSMVLPTSGKTCFMLWHVTSPMSFYPARCMYIRILIIYMLLTLITDPAEDLHSKRKL